MQGFKPSVGTNKNNANSSDERDGLAGDSTQGFHFDWNRSAVFIGDD